MSTKQLLKNIHTYFVIFTTGYKNYTAYIHDIVGLNIIFVLRISVIIFSTKRYTQWQEHLLSMDILWNSLYDL